MVKQTRRTDRCFLHAAGGSVTTVRFPAGPVQRVPSPRQQVSGSESSDSRRCCSTASTEQKRGRGGRSHAGGHGSDGGSGEMESKRARHEGNKEAAASTNRIKAPGSSDPAEAGVSDPDQQGAAEHSEDSRAAQLQGVGSLKVTIQRSSDSRAFGQTDRRTAGLHCHVCSLTCRSLQVFQEHMSGQEHQRKLQEITHSIHLNTHTLLDRGRQPQDQRWCDTCQIHFTGDIIIHRRTKQHKVCKQLGRPFCPVCKRHFRTPRKFVEHMKSAEHKEQVQLEEAQEEELITVDAVGCFEEEKEEEEEEVEVAEEEEEKESSATEDMKEQDEEEQDEEQQDEEEQDEEQQDEEEQDEEQQDEEEQDEEEQDEEEQDEEEQDEEEHEPHLTSGSGFVVPVRGFVCRLCNKFFYKEASARHTHT